MTVYSVAVVGLGVGQGHIAEAYAPLTDLFDLRLVCDLDEARLAQVYESHGVEGTTNFDDVLARPDIDIVDICTPSAMHLPLAKAALAAGKHVVCEKPLVGSLAELADLREAERNAPGVLMPIYQYRWGSGAQAARKIIDAGLAGRPLVGTAETHWLRTPEYYASPWRGTWAGELGGTMTTHATHIHDMLTWLMGPPEAVFGRSATRVHDIEVEDCASASLRLASGALASLTATVGSRDEYSRLYMAFENVSFESTRAPYAVGRGPWTITARDPELQAQVDAIAAETANVRERFAGQLSAFHESLSTGAPPPVTIDDADAALSLLTAFYRSSQTGREVQLPFAANDPARAGWTPATLTEEV
ncbi:Predicted dehydrogenase [Tranquillimonas rosea]|uniref:Predicted dehydrogenase n=1 Tax=Tranquillimonas rosea TaxID=641238 RepID=A0A1H9WLE9_9RHOB|nr:Gfo/Idh/MocA family oxidoreductase [Tranquillimonas rosea]SES34651.1 Predicted dehydrogenase [Tranquillimonas rosea]